MSDLTPILRQRLGVLLLLLALTYFLGEAWAAAGWEGRPYRWSEDAISALGVPERMGWAGESAVSTRHAVMNATFIGSGLRVALAGLVLAPFVPRRGRTAVLGVVLAHAVGLVLVGAFPTAMEGIRSTVHGIGAWLGVVGGSVALVVVGLALARAHPRVAALTGVLAVISLAGSVIAVVGEEHFGLYERIAVDTVLVWQVLLGAALAVSSKRGSLGQGQ